MATNTSCVLTFTSCALLTLATSSFASSPDAWAAHNAEVTATCIKASGLKDAKLVGDLLEYDDRVGFTAAMISGVYPQPHMKKQRGRSLCLFDKRTRTPYTASADQIK